MEEFFKSYQHTFEALGAIATAAAVTISLVLARREAEKLTAKLSVWQTVGELGVQEPACLKILVKNTRVKTAYIPVWYFWFKVPFCSEICTIVPRRTEVIELAAGRSELIKVMPLPTFHSECQRAFRNLKWLRKWRVSRVKAYICTESGGVYRVKFDKSFKKQLSKLVESLKN